MSNFNKVMLMGRLTRDPQLSYLPSQTPVAEIGVVVNDRRKKQDGSYEEVPCFVDCVCFGKRGEAINKYLKKGDSIFISGKLQFESWEDKNSGAKRSKLKVFIEDFQFIGQGNKNGQQDSSPAKESGYNAPPAQSQFEKNYDIPAETEAPPEF